MCVTMETQSYREHNQVGRSIVKWYEPHQCKLGFGYPTQVWNVTQEPGYSMIPLLDINSRLIHTRRIVIGSQFLL